MRPDLPPRLPTRLLARLLAVVLWGLAALLAGPAGPTGAPASASGPPEYVALGDSYASGVGTASYAADGSGCLRSARSYPAVVAERLGYALRLRACVGATVAHVSEHQLDALDGGTDYVTLSAGGNDAGFARVLTECALPWWMPGCERAVDRARAFVRDTLPGRLDALYAAVARRAPGAVVVVVGYPRLFTGEDCDLGTWFSRAEQARLNDAADLLDRTTARVAAAHGFAFADPRERFTGHAVCDRREWVNGLTVPVVESFHPNRAGHAAGYAPLVARLLRGTSERPVARSAASPGPERGTTLRTRPFRKPDLSTSRAERAAARHGIDIERWVRRHP